MKFNSLEIWLNKKCNLSCDYCEFKSNEKDAKISEKIYDQLKNNKFTEVKILGGEPLIYDHFKELIETIHKYHKSDIILYTNIKDISKVKSMVGDFRKISIIASYHPIDNPNHLKSFIKNGLFLKKIVKNFKVHYMLTNLPIKTHISNIKKLIKIFELEVHLLYSDLKILSSKDLYNDSFFKNLLRDTINDWDKVDPFSKKKCKINQHNIIIDNHLDEYCFCTKDVLNKRNLKKSSITLQNEILLCEETCFDDLEFCIND